MYAHSARRIRQKKRARGGTARPFSVAGWRGEPRPMGPDGRPRYSLGVSAGVTSAVSSTSATGMVRCHVGLRRDLAGAFSLRKAARSKRGLGVETPMGHILSGIRSKVGSERHIGREEGPRAPHPDDLPADDRWAGGDYALFRGGKIGGGVRSMVRAKRTLSGWKCAGYARYGS